MRGFLVDEKPDTAAKMWKEELKIYPLKDASNPLQTEIINGSWEVFNTIHANTYGFYEELSNVIQKVPISFPNPELRGQAAPIGIIKGQPFEPNHRLKKHGN